MNEELLKASKASMKDAIENGKTEEFVDEAVKASMIAAKEYAEQVVMARYNEMGRETDDAILASRGMHVLTREEKTFYDNFTKMVRGAGEGLTNPTVALPVTVTNRAMENMIHNHELLSKIDFVNSQGLTDWIISKNLNFAGAWGDLVDPIVTGANAAFAKVEFAQYKLTTWIPVPLTLLELGQTWLDTFVVTYLGEIIARKLEDAIVNGDGQKKPVGMIKVVNIESQTVPAVDKQAITVTDLSTTTIGDIASQLTDNGERVVSMIDMIVNPMDYWKLVYPALYYTNHDGQVVKSNVPINVIQSNAVPADHAVFGLCERYFATVGINSKLTKSDEYKFLEDLRIYKCKSVCFGSPKDNTSFLYADISGLLEAAVPTRAQKSRP